MYYDEYTGCKQSHHTSLELMEEVGLPGVDEYAGMKCGASVERITGNRSLSEGADEGQGHNSHFHSVNTV